MKIFIPIKEQSQRVPGKNFRDFNGKSLYSHTLDKFAGSGHQVFIDTDSEDLIYKVRENYGNDIQIYKRHKHLCGHEVSVNLLISNWIYTYLNNIDEEERLVQMHVTNPFLELKTLERAEIHMKQRNYDSIASVSVLKQRLWRIDSKNTPIALNHNPNELKQTQDLEDIYGENSVFYMFTKQSFCKYNHRFNGNRGFYAVDYPEDLDIDTEDNWNFCVNLIKNYGKN